MQYDFANNLHFLIKFYNIHLLFSQSFGSIKYMRKNKVTKSIFLLIVLVSLIGCKSTEIVIPEDLSASQLIQRGQDAAANNKFEEADKYYVATIDRYGQDLKCYVEARYELAHSFTKQKRYDEAKTMFNEIISIFEQPNAIYQVQPKYKKLAQIGLATIEEAEKAKQAKEK